ncbi:aspartate/glutamate racemase family protein [Tropicimonas sp.]|uniref:aspartate/glutamate racemase family protein n=1 Tax=Tropicimonas sp. TaxID=2067044 RepID=UPI003A85E45C
MTSPRIVLLHATPVAMEPVLSAMTRLWPEALAVNLLDDGLSHDRAQETGALSERLTARLMDLGRYAVGQGADGILATCSAFGPALDRMAADLPVPVVKPNEAMFRQALRQGRRIGMLATFGPSVAAMEREFHDFAGEAGAEAELTTLLVADALDRLREGDGETHNRLVARRAAELDAMDAIMLAHFSTSRAAALVHGRVGVPVLTAPEAAVRAMREELEKRAC